MNKIILGIDPGIADTGFGVIEKDKQDNLTCLDYGSIKTEANLELAERLVILNDDLNTLIKKYKPHVIAIEQLFFCKNVKTALTVGHARGVVLLNAKQHDLKMFEFTPLQIKQAVSAYGKAPKSQVQEMVKIILDLDKIPKPDDAADGLAAAICASNFIN